MDAKPTPRRSWSLRRKLLIIIPLIIIILGLALGLGLGLTLGGDNGNDEGSSPTVTASPLPTPTGKPAWSPRVNDTWQIVLQNNIIVPSGSATLDPDVEVYDIDLFENSKETIDALHKLGKKVICYFSGGSYEPGRPDSGEFQKEDMGKVMDGWPDEKWIKLGSENVRRIMKGRIELASQKGCDGVDPDNVDGYDSIDFMSYLSNLTQPLNLTLGLKNAGDIISTVLPIVGFSVNEQCVAENECSVFHQFIDAGKPVFHIEYPDGAGGKIRTDISQKFCGTTGAAQGSDGFSTILKKMDLDGWVQYCNGQVKVTAMNTTDPGN